MIAVLMATYNGEKYLEEQFDSLLNQTYKDFICYIHDDGSNDGTLKIINKYIKDYPDKFCYIDGEKTGSSMNNFFFLLSMVEADYYMFCDQDDVWLPDKIKKTYLKVLDEEKKNVDKPILAFCDMKVVDKDLNVISNSFVKYNMLDVQNLEFNRLIVQNSVAGCTSMFNRIARDEGIKYKQTNSPECIMIHDWWIALVCAAMGKVTFVREALMLYRQHGDNNVGATKEYGFKVYIKLFFFLITFSHVKKTKIRIEKFVRQAQQLEIYSLSGDNKEILNTIKNFYKMNKFQRIKAFKKYNIYRNRRNVWQLICL